MRVSKTCCVLILAATFFAGALRLPGLAQRPMHGDEAVHADKFGRLLERGEYKYDPHEYHGPTLNYLTLIPARILSEKTYAQVNEFTLRVVPAFFGVVLVLLVLLVADGVGAGAAVYAAVLTAISPAMVYYSRYYIQEMLLVCFTFGAIVFAYRYGRRRRLLWAVLAGACVGLMHATKETCVIAFGSMLAGLWLTFFLGRREGGEGLGAAARRIRPGHFVAALAVAAGVSALLYSSFLANPRGIVDSFATYGTYFRRAAGNLIHEHPWYYYLRMLLYSHWKGGPVWSEGLIVVLAVVGGVAVVAKRGLGGMDLRLLRFVVFYTLMMVVLYSVIRYKTPWCMLGFLHGMIVLAGVGAAVLVRSIRPVVPKLLLLFFLFDMSALLLWQACQASYKYHSDSRNPYVYAHPTTEVFEIVRVVEEYARVHPDGRRMRIEVICPGDDYWPLPWYFRSFENVAWRSGVDKASPPASIIIASPAVEAELVERFYDESIPFEQRRMYLRLFERPYYMWLRPQVELVGFVTKELWERRQRLRVPDPNELMLEQGRR